MTNIDTGSGCTSQHRGRGERGAALVEFAIAATLFIGLIYGCVSYGVIFWVKSTITHAAAEGARTAIRETNLSTIESATEARANNSLPANYKYADATVAAPSTCPSDPGATCVTVTVTYPYKAHAIVPALPPVFPFLPDELKSSSTIQVS